MIILSSFLIMISVEGDLLEDHPPASFDWHLLPGDTSTLFLNSGSLQQLHCGSSVDETYWKEEGRGKQGMQRFREVMPKQALEYIQVE